MKNPTRYHRLERDYVPSSSQCDLRTATCRMSSSFSCNVAIIVFLMMLWFVALACAQSWSGPTFKEFAGENSGDATSGNDPLIGQALDWNRPGIEMPIWWTVVEPTQGTWDLSYITNAGLHLLQWPTGASNCVVYLDGVPSWDTNPATWLPDWTNYVKDVVSYLHAPPYNIEYFQIWNEPYGESDSFWPNGTWSAFFTYVHLPAAKVIHSYGAKVVFGGYPSAADSSIDDYINQLDTYNAWGSIDVLDTHYYAPNAWALLRPAADSRGYTNMAIWQTEVGNTSSNAFVANEFTRSFVWSLNNNWNSPNKYKWFFFTHYSTDGKSLMIPGKNLTSNGYQMQELGTLLGSNVFSAYSGITSSLSGLNQASLARASTSLEAVADGHQIVAFVHLSPFDYNANSSVTLTFPISNNRVISAQRVDLMGNNVILTTAGTSTTSVLVGTHDASGSSSFAWNSKQLSQGYAATFYVLLAIVSAAPTGVTDTAVSASQINVGWSASSGATSYNVKRATVSGGPYSTIANVTTESYSDTGLPSGTTYHYVISAMNASGESGNSAQVSATTFPAAPTGVTDTAVSASQINVGWSASSGATSYNVKRATVSGGPYTTVATLTNTTYNNTGLSSDTTYHYVVSALNASGESGDSAQVSATTFPPALLSQGRPTSASSFQTGNIVSNGNDGSLATRWAAVDSSYPQWWRVDLGATHNLSQVVINWYNSSSRSYKYKIEVSDDDATYSTVVNQTARTASGDSTDNFSAVGRYLRVTVTGANAGWAGFYECKVYGE